MKNISIIYLIGLLLFSSCNNLIDPGSVDTPASGDTPLSISSVSVSGSAYTKAVTAQTSGSIGVFRTTANGYTALNNVQYTYSSGWTASSPIYLNTAAASVCGYYPYGASGITSSTDPTSVTLTSQAYSAAQDLCYSTLVNTATSTSPGVTFTMNHAYAKLYLNITRDASYPNTCAITNISIANAGIKTSNTLNITTGAYGTGTAGTVSYNPGISSIASGGSATTQVLMVPVTTAMSGNVNISFTIDGTVLTASFSSLTTLLSGNNYKINITVKASSLSITGVDVAAWGDVNTSDIGYLSEYNIVPESNCYIVAPGGAILIPVSRASTGNAANFPSGSSFTTGLLWSDVSATHVTATVSDRYIKVVAGSTEGNSVVYAKNTGGTIVWSWHIWVTNYNPGTTANTGTNTTTYSYNSNLWMDRNLGATTTTPATQTTKGLLYQWGRKDPFPGSSTYNGTTEPTLYGTLTSVTKTAAPTGPNLVVSIQNPLTFYCSASGNADWYASGTGTQNNTLWYDGTATKTIYDPCPVGWRVPFFTGTISPWNGLSATGGTWNSGYTWSSIGYYPASGYRYSSDGTLTNVGSNGFYWSATVSGLNAYDLCFLSGGVYPSGYNGRALGVSVRCVKN